jgi:transcriptional regulator with XRE-family HTH domain
MNIGEKIRYARLQKGYSQENMADFLGISTSAYGDIERNKTELTLSRVKKLAKILKIKAIEFLEEDHQSIEMATLPNHIELEKLRAEAKYWREKFEQQVIKEAYRTIQSQYQREKIGF